MAIDALLLFNETSFQIVGSAFVLFAIVANKEAILQNPVAGKRLKARKLSLVLMLAATIRFVIRIILYY
jgi:hypothetical protein